MATIAVQLKPNCWQVPLFNLENVAIVLQLWCACPQDTVLHTGCLCVCLSEQYCHQKQPLCFYSLHAQLESFQNSCSQSKRADPSHTKNKGV